MFRRRDMRLPLLAWQAGFWLFWSVATAAMVLPATQLPTVNLWDKAEHALTFAVLMGLVWPAYRHRCSTPVLAALLIGYGLAIECIQYFIPSRSFSLPDVLADSVGIVLAVCIVQQVKTG